MENHVIRVLSPWRHDIQLKFMCSMSDIMKCCLLLSILSLCSCTNARITRDREARLRPVIEYIDAYINKHRELPSEKEFRSATMGMEVSLVLRDRNHKYAASNGAKTDKDYMVGIWRADWYHYYKSWDRSFLNGSDEKFAD